MEPLREGGKVGKCNIICCKNVRRACALSCGEPQGTQSHTEVLLTWNSLSLQIILLNLLFPPCLVQQTEVEGIERPAIS